MIGIELTWVTTVTIERIEQRDDDIYVLAIVDLEHGAVSATLYDGRAIFQGPRYDIDGEIKAIEISHADGTIVDVWLGKAKIERNAK